MLSFLKSTSSSGTAPTQRRVTLILILGSLAAFGPLSIDMYLAAFPLIADDLATSPSAVQATLTATILGLGLGGLVIGPFSDARGRRAPLVIGLGVYIASSIACAFAPNIALLALFRFIQGFSGATGVVLSRAVARDIHSGPQLAKFMATLLLVNGLAPILAPLVGSEVLRYTSWRGIFLVLAAFGLILLLATTLRLNETLEPERRSSAGVRENLRIFRRLLTNRGFAGYALTTGLGMAVMFSYISGSSYVLQEVYKLSPQQYGLAFGANALGFVIVAQVGGRVVHRTGPGPLLTTGLVGVTLGTTSFLAAVLTNAPLGLVLPALFATIAILGLVPPNAAALAMNDQGGNAGAASGLLSLMQFSIGGLAAPIVGLAGEDAAWPMACVMVVLAVGALTVRLTLVHPAKMRARRQRLERRHATAG